MQRNSKVQFLHDVTRCILLGNITKFLHFPMNFKLHCDTPEEGIWGIFWKNYIFYIFDFTFFFFYFLEYASPVSFAETLSVVLNFVLAFLHI